MCLFLCRLYKLCSPFATVSFQLITTIKRFILYLLSAPMILMHNQSEFLIFDLKMCNDYFKLCEN